MNPFLHSPANEENKNWMVQLYKASGMNMTVVYAKLSPVKYFSPVIGILYIR